MVDIVMYTSRILLCVVSFLNSCVKRSKNLMGRASLVSKRVQAEEDVLPLAMFLSGRKVVYSVHL